MPESNPVTLISEQLSQILSENVELRESLDEVRMMFAAEDRGWALISGWMTGEHLEGFDLDELKDVSEKIRPHVVGDALVRRGSELHIGYVWSKGIDIEGTQPKKGPGARSGLLNFFEDTVNQEELFSTSAHAEMQRARYADGNLFLACNSRDKTVRKIPLNQITALKVNPDFPTDVWAYRRTWNTQDGTNVQLKTRWYYTNRFTGTVPATITYNNVVERVDQDIRMIDRRFNRMPGYVLGIPDSIAMHVWVSAYNEILEYGRIVNEGLAKILFKIVSGTKNAANNAAVKVSNMRGFGNAASMVEGQDIQAISTAGKGYDFSSARPVSAMAATAINVPNIELLSDSAAAGSSYGAAASLSPATLNAMRVMQDEWVDLFSEVFRFFKFSPQIGFDPITDVDPYRAAQQLALLSIALTDEERRAKALDLLNISGDPTEIPPALKAATTSAIQAASPDQGVSNGTGSAGAGANDLRTDQIAQALRVGQEDRVMEMLERITEYIARQN